MTDPDRFLLLVIAQRYRETDDRPSLRESLYLSELSCFRE